MPMSSPVISDNWSLQEISELLTAGIDSADTHFIKIDRDSDSYSYEKIPSAIVKIETLFDFITDIILRDQIIVDDNFTQSWKGNNNPLHEVEKAGLIRPFPFLQKKEKLDEPRKNLVNRMCVTSDLVKDQEEHDSLWNSKIKSPHDYLAQILWGGAGMLARSFVYEMNYTPHPIRKRFFHNSGVLLSAEDAVAQLKSTLRENRATLATKVRGQDELYSLYINLPPLPILSIREANSIHDILKIAIQIRDEYKELRGWLDQYQQALTDGKYNDINKFQKILSSISQYIESITGSINPNAPTFTTGISVLKIAIKGQPINTLLNQFGIRSIINQLITESTGNQELKKLLGFLNHRNSATGMAVIEHFSK